MHIIKSPLPLPRRLPSFCMGNLSIPLVLLGGLLFLFLFLLLVEARRHLVQAEDGLVGVLDEDELSVFIGAGKTHVGNGSDDTPAVGQREVHLVGKVTGLPADDAQNNVLVIGAGIQS